MSLKDWMNKVESSKLNETATLGMQGTTTSTATAPKVGQKVMVKPGQPQVGQQANAQQNAQQTNAQNNSQVAPATMTTQAGKTIAQGDPAQLKKLGDLVNTGGITMTDPMSGKPIQEEDVMEVAPPGMEDMVMQLKKEYPGQPQKAYATAWSIYNKKHGKKAKTESVSEGTQMTTQLNEGATLEDIIANFPHEHKQCQEGWGMDESLYEALCDHYFKEGRIPRVIWHGPLQELRKHVEECYGQDTMPVEEGMIGSALGGLAGGALTKSIGGAMTGADIGSQIQDALSEDGLEEDSDDKFGVADKVEELVSQHNLYDKRGWTDLFAELAGRKLQGQEIYREMEYASKFLQLLDSIRMRSDYRGKQNPKLDQELVDLSNQWLSLFNKATSEFKEMGGQGVAEGDGGQQALNSVGIPESDYESVEEESNLERDIRDAAMRSLKDQMDETVYESKQVNEKWDTKMKTAAKDVGKWDGYTIAELKARKAKLMKKEERTAAEQKEVKQIDFAIRAKHEGSEKWGKVEESNEQIIGEEQDVYTRKTKQVSEGETIEKAGGRVHKGTYGTSHEAGDEGVPKVATQRGRGRPKKDADETGEVKKYDWSAFGASGKDVKLPKWDKSKTTKHKIKDESIEEAVTELPGKGRIHTAEPGGYGRRDDEDEKGKTVKPTVKKGRGRPKKGGDETGEVKKYDWSAFGASGKDVKLPKWDKSKTTKHKIKDSIEPADAMLESWDRQLSALLSEGVSQVSEGRTISISTGQEAGQDSVNISATDEDAHELLKMLQMSGISKAPEVAAAVTTAPAHETSSQVAKPVPTTSNLVARSVAPTAGISIDVEPSTQDEIISDLASSEHDDSGEDAMSFLKKMLGHTTSQEVVDEVDHGDYIKQQDAEAEASGKDKFKAFGQEFDTDEVNEEDENGDNAEEQEEMASDATRDAALAQAYSADQTTNKNINVSEDEDQENTDAYNDAIFMDKKSFVAKATKEYGMSQEDALAFWSDSNGEEEPTGEFWDLVDTKDDWEPGMDESKVCEDCGHAKCSCDNDGKVDESRLFTNLLKMFEEKSDERDDRAEKAGKKVTKDIEYDEGHKGKDDAKAERAGRKVTKDIEYDEKKDKLDEWANTVQGDSEDETFTTDIDFMTKFISGGLNNIKRDQTVLPSAEVVTKEEASAADDSIAEQLRKLAGIN